MSDPTPADTVLPDVRAVSSDEFRTAVEVAARTTFTAVLVAESGAAVPTCPQWSVRQLTAHLGMVHRWARAQLVGGEAPFADEAAVLSQVRVPDLPAWLLDGADALVAVLRDAPADLDAWVFMDTDRTPVEFWHRRQASETVVHAVDAMAVARGSVPTAAEVTAALDGVLTPAFAVDGLDELLVRFSTRGRSKLWDGSPLSIVVAADDVDAAWTLAVTEEALTVTPGAADDADARWTGTAAQLYLGLWNRGEEVTVDGDPETLHRWRARQRVRW
ncbi:maleylpyruvate isomerase family mycothiol-dependent enzyme [Williamsia deligens]|uniref:Maleylpyruvate isomerase family mycothiol-dependent enzyme n=1 Tax=Williamsia deligens TaxID=321325 RepID=A0ABW3G561_9NOCA|nr:maleylpyruvate isomerase family mycothiol-dependent enzyme [Williamsia deligens]MCP2193916.1 TIGR03083 family protein [Williamsia deligens]